MSILQMEERREVLRKLAMSCIHKVVDQVAAVYYMEEFYKVVDQIKEAKKLWQSQ